VSERLLEFKDYFPRSGVPRQNLPRLLRLDRARRGESASQRGQQEVSALHAGTVDPMGAKVNAPHA
jgi:hypothetical protein